MKSTGNASKASYSSVVGVSPFTFYLHPSQGEGSALEDIFRAAGEGLYITDLEGLHAGANPVSGDFSLSSKGFLITEGKKGAPVKNITVSGSFFELLKKVEIIGNDLELLRGKFGSPAILVRDMAVAGKDI